MDPILRMPASDRAIRSVKRGRKANQLQLRAALGRQARRVSQESGWGDLHGATGPLTAEDIIRAYDKLNEAQSKERNQ